MGRRRDTEGLPELPHGLTMTEAAARLTALLGREVKAHQVNYLVTEKGAATLHTKTVEVARQVEVLAVAETDLARLAEAFEAVYA